MDIGWRHLAETLVDSFAHGARRRAAALRVSGCQIGEHLVVAPAADAGALVGGDVEGVPARRHGAGELFAVVQSETKIPRRVAFAAMGQRFGDIGASVPFRAAIGIGRKASSRTPSTSAG